MRTRLEEFSLTFSCVCAHWLSTTTYRWEKRVQRYVLCIFSKFISWFMAGLFFHECRNKCKLTISGCGKNQQITYYETTVLDHGRGQELLVKEALHIQTTPSEERFNRDGGLEVPGCWIAVMRRQGGRSNPHWPLTSNDVYPSVVYGYK